MTNNYEQVEIVDVDHKPSYKHKGKLYGFKDTTSMLLTLIDHHFYGQFKHYWYGQVPQGYPESEASRQIRNNYQYFANLPHQPISIKTM